MPDSEEQLEAAMTFTGQEAAYAQTALRGVMGLPPESFPLQAFVGMISDEIEQLREHGFTDASIAELISEITSKTVSADSVSRWYAEPDSRRHS